MTKLTPQELLAFLTRSAGDIPKEEREDVVLLLRLISSALRSPADTADILDAFADHLEK